MNKYAELRNAAAECTHTARLFDVSEIRSLLDDIDVARNRIRELEDALREIAKCEGRFDRDPLGHASNVIEASRLIAEKALNHAE